MISIQLLWQLMSSVILEIEGIKENEESVVPHRVYNNYGIKLKALILLTTDM